MTLLQIAGVQTWPNFLPLLGYQPAKVVFLTRADADGKLAAITHLRTALGHAGHDAEFITLATPGEQPTLIECLRLLEEQLPADIDLINLTGGTKAMSLAAYEFAKSHAIPSFLLNARRPDCPFEDLATAEHPLPFPDLTTIAHRVDVRIALEAQGFPVPESFKQPSPAHLHFSIAAADLRHDETADHEIGAAIAQLRLTLTGGDGGKFLRKGKLRPVLQRPIEVAPGSAWHRYLKAAAAHDVVQPLGPASYRLVTLDPLTAHADDLQSEVETRFKLLEGIWFELALLEKLRSGSAFSDIRWSVEGDKSTDPAAGSKGETDLVAFHPETFNLHFLSCKTGGPHATPLEHIQGLRRRATKEGGESAKAELWIFRPRSEDHRRDLESHCREQGVGFHVFTEEFRSNTVTMP